MRNFLTTFAHLDFQFIKAKEQLNRTEIELYFYYLFRESFAMHVKKTYCNWQKIKRRFYPQEFFLICIYIL